MRLQKSLLRGPELCLPHRAQYLFIAFHPLIPPLPTTISSCWNLILLESSFSDSNFHPRTGLSPKTKDTACLISELTPMGTWLSSDPGRPLRWATHTHRGLAFSLPLREVKNQRTKGKGKEKSLSHVRLFVTPRTMQSMEFSRPEYWSG